MQIPVIYTFTVLHPANSLVNPVIYSFRLPIFREAVGKLKLKKKQKQSKEYVISWHSWNFIFFYNYVKFSKMSKKKMPVMIVHLQNKEVAFNLFTFAFFFKPSVHFIINKTGVSLWLEIWRVF